MEYMPAPPNTEAGMLACYIHGVLECQEHVVWLVNLKDWIPLKQNTSTKNRTCNPWNPSMCFHGMHSSNATMKIPNDQSGTQNCKLHPLPIRRLYAAHGKFRVFTLNSKLHLITMCTNTSYTPSDPKTYPIFVSTYLNHVNRWTCCLARYLMSGTWKTERLWSQIQARKKRTCNPWNPCVSMESIVSLRPSGDPMTNHARKLSNCTRCLYGGYMPPMENSICSLKNFKLHVITMSAHSNDTPNDPRTYPIFVSTYLNHVNRWTCCLARYLVSGTCKTEYLWSKIQAWKTEYAFHGIHVFPWNP